MDPAVVYAINQSLFQFFGTGGNKKLRVARKKQSKQPLDKPRHTVFLGQLSWLSELRVHFFWPGRQPPCAWLACFGRVKAGQKHSDSSHVFTFPGDPCFAVARGFYDVPFQGQLQKA